MKHLFSFPASRKLTGYGRQAVLLLALAGLVPAAAAQIVLTASATYGAGGSAQGIVSADFNGDGRPDLATANSSDDNIGVLLQSSSTPGTFNAAATYSSGGSFAPVLATGDLNGDGRPDLAVANQNSGTVGVLLNSAVTPGTFAAAVIYPIGGTTGRGVAIADVDGDGRLDLVASSSNLVAVLLQSTTTPGTFAAAVTYPSGSGSGITDELKVADVNGDGRPDVIVANRQTNTVGVLLNSAATPGTLGAAVNYTVNGNAALRGIAVGDLNNDARPDIVVTNDGTSTISVLLNSATTPGTFPTTASYANGANGPLGVVTGDLNGDGLAEIVSQNYDNNTGNTISLLVNAAAAPGTFPTAAVKYVSVGTGPIHAVIGDLNADGRPDVAVSNLVTHNVSILLNSTVFAPTLTGISPGSGPVGTGVTLTGTTLTGTTGVSFNGTAATTFAVVNATTVTATVPAGATTGNVTVTMGSGTSNGLLFTVNTTSVAWTGATSTDWATASNWSPAVVPTSTIDVAIPSAPANQPVVAGTQPAKNVAVAPGARLTLAAGSLLTLDNAGSLTLGAGSTFTQGAGSEIYLAGNLTNNGATFALNPTSEVGFGDVSAVNHVLNGTAGVTFQTLTVGELGQFDNLSIQVPTQVRHKLGVYNSSIAIVDTGGSLTLLSDATGTALVENATGGTVAGTVTVQRYIDPTLNPGLGYRHYSAPVSNSTVNDLATTTGFTPVVNPNYNTSATPYSETPFPTVYGYDQSRLTATTTTNVAPLDKGYFSPTALTDALVVGRGYTVNLGGDQLVDFTGALNNGDLTIPLARNAATTRNNTNAGWQLLGNPYPAPLDYSLVAAADRGNLDAAIYVFSSTSQYQGQYRSYVNNVGNNSVLPVGQAFFARVSAGQTSGSLTFRNTQRLTAPDVTIFQRPTDLRPLVQLDLRGATGPADALFAYAEAGPTPAFDARYDAEKLPNPTGLNLSSTATSGERLAIDGRPAFTATTMLPLAMGVPAAGSYSLTAVALNNIPAALDAFLSDAATGQTVNLRLQPAYSFTLSAAQAAALVTGRFTLHFAARAALATAPALTAAQVALYPNPAHDRFAVAVPAVAGATQVRATLLNALGQVVRQQVAALPAAGAQLTVPTAGLAAGVYTLRLQAGSATLAKRVVVE